MRVRQGLRAACLLAAGLWASGCQPPEHAEPMPAPDDAGAQETVPPAAVESAVREEENVSSEIDVTSPAFPGGERIPKKHAYKGEGDNVSPPLEWSGVPDAAQELVLIVDDPDAPRDEPWVHWVVYGIPPLARRLPAGVPTDAAELDDPAGAVQGRNDWGKVGWGGPFPPPGHGTHHYHFELMALSEKLDLPNGATKAEVLEKAKGKILAEGELVGTYSR